MSMKTNSTLRFRSCTVASPDSEGYSLRHGTRESSLSESKSAPSKRFGRIVKDV